MYHVPTLIILFITKNLKHPSFDALLKLQKCLILTKSTLPEGEGYLWVPSPTMQGYIYSKTNLYPCFNSIPISENIIHTSTKSKTKKLSSQTIKKNLPTSTPKGYMTITCHHRNNRDKYIVLQRILIGGQFYLNTIIIKNLHTSYLYENNHKYMQYDLLYYSYFAQWCNKEFWEKWNEITLKKDAELHLALKSHI